MIWSQNYDPLGHPLLSALVAAVPVALLLGLLAIWHVRAQVAAAVGLACAALIAMAVFRMPGQMVGMAAGYGAGFGLFPIGWIIVNAIFIYQIAVETGQFAVLQKQVAGLSADRRIQALLIAFSFGAFIEGAAGFGAPVAITGALMIGLGFRPLEAAKLALIGNTAPVAFGALGTPLLTLAKVTGLDLGDLSAMVGRQLPIFSVLVPFWLVVAQCGWRGMVGVWPACLVAGLSFAMMQFWVSNYHGPWLVDIAGAIVSMLALVILTKFWQPKDAPAAVRTESEPSVGVWRAWVPWVLLSAFVFLWGLPVVKDQLDGWVKWSTPVPGLHLAVQKMPPVELHPEPEKAEYTLNLLSSTGTALLLAGICAGACLGLGPLGLLRIYRQTLWRLRVSLLTIALMLALGFTARYSGTDTTMGLAMAGTGFWFPFFSPIIGWLGVALTGSDTSSNVLFGNLQSVTAQQLGLPAVLMAAANSSGGVMGKMIDAQSIVVASVATGGHADSPDAGTVLRAVFWHSVGLAVAMGVLIMIQAYLMPWIVPG